MRSVRQSGLDTRLQQSLADLAAQTPDAAALWRDYEERAVFYNGLLIEVGELAPDIEAGQGFIPADIARRVHNHPLDLSLMRASLRGYQAFGAKFALCQQRAMLGDEMGLGKSVEALAAMCHLRVEGRRHFLVVCPASVLVNWTHEIRRHSELEPHRLHGPDRQQNLQAWTRAGGVAVTTYDSLRSLPKPAGVRPRHARRGRGALRQEHGRRAHQGGPAVGARRPAGSCSSPAPRWRTGSRNSGSWSATSSPTSSPRISTVDGLIGAGHFRAAVAPVYLRRNQARRAAGAASPRRDRGVGGAGRPRSGRLPGCRRRGQLHGHAPGRLRARQPGRLRQAGPARRDRRGSLGQRPQGRGVLLLPRRAQHRRLRPRRRGARPADRQHPAGPPAGHGRRVHAPAAAPRSW